VELLPPALAEKPLIEAEICAQKESSFSDWFTVPVNVSSSKVSSCPPSWTFFALHAPTF